MRIVFTSYVQTKEYNEPLAWLNRLDIYVGILEELAKTHEVVSIMQIRYEGEIVQNGVNYHFKRYSKNSLRFFPLKLNQHIKSLQPDVVIIQGLHLPLQVIQLRLLLGRKVKIIEQNRAEKPFNGYKKILQQLADRSVDAYLFTALTMGLDWVKAGNLKSAKKIHEVMGLSSVFYPIEKSLAQQKTGTTGSPIFLWAGRLNANKDPLTVVNAFSDYLKINPAAKLYMIYQTYELLEEIKLMINSPNIILVGNIAHADLLYWFNSATFLLSGSHYEGGGTVLAEAMSCNCIPIVTNIPSFNMLTDNGKCGILYEAGNKDDLLNALYQTLNMDIEMKQKQCFAYYKAHLSFDAIAKKIEQIILALNAEKG
jgi:glycosyltransferase involved in cell wall biosynthesis